MINTLIDSLPKTQSITSFDMLYWDNMCSYYSFIICILSSCISKLMLVVQYRHHILALQYIINTPWCMHNVHSFKVNLTQNTKKNPNVFTALTVYCSINNILHVL